jgi:hypothetical protein
VAGYSEKSLLNKLGYLAGETVFTIGAEPWLLEELKANGINNTDSLPATWLHAFFTDSKLVIDFLNKTDLTQIEKGLWVSWPKKSSGVSTDLTEQSFRLLILPMGWVDTKVCAVNDIWSGLKFLRRKFQKPISE